MEKRIKGRSMWKIEMRKEKRWVDGSGGTPEIKLGLWKVQFFSFFYVFSVLVWGKIKKKGLSEKGLSLNER